MNYLTAISGRTSVRNLIHHRSNNVPLAIRFSSSGDARGRSRSNQNFKNNNRRNNNYRGGKNFRGGGKSAAPRQYEENVRNREFRSSLNIDENVPLIKNDSADMGSRGSSSVAGFRPMSQTYINMGWSRYADLNDDDDDIFMDDQDETTSDILKVDPIYSYDNQEKIDELTRSIREFEQEKQDRKEKGALAAQPKVRVQELDMYGRAYGRGSRKTSQARVWVFPGEGNITVNNKELVDYFDRASDRELLLAPFVVTRTCGMFDVHCIVKGGVLRGQAGAVRHGLARALEKYNPDYFRRTLKSFGYLTRDSRMVERKKYGLKKARKAPQWVKR